MKNKCSVVLHIALWFCKPQPLSQLPFYHIYLQSHGCSWFDKMCVNRLLAQVYPYNWCLCYKVCETACFWQFVLRWNLWQQWVYVILWTNSISTCVLCCGLISLPQMPFYYSTDFTVTLLNNLIYVGYAWIKLVSTEWFCNVVGMFYVRRWLLRMLSRK